MKNCIWDWQDFRSWNDTAWRLMEDVLTPNVVAAFKQSPPKYVVGDDLTWLEELVEQENGYSTDMRELLAYRLMDQYTAIRAYHGSRPLDVDSFYKRGLLRLDPDQFEELARATFLGSVFPEIYPESVQAGIDGVGRAHREGLLYFEANESHLLEYCAHYMLYGSEYLCAIAANIPGTRDYRQHLKNFGTPTIFVCDVPLTLLDYRLLRELAGYALESLFSTLVDPTFKHNSSCRGTGIYIRHDLPAECVVGHKSPQVLKDPFLGYKPVQIMSSSLSNNETTGEKKT